MRLLMFLFRNVTLLVVALQHLCNAQPFPDAPSDLTVEFMEDTRDGFLQHAVLDFSWTPPTNGDILSGYELVIEHVPPNDTSNGTHSCSTTQDPVVVPLEPDLTAFRFVSDNGSFSSLPIYTCTYTAMLVSMPGDMSSEELNFIVEYSSDFQKSIQTRMLQFSCDSFYDPATVHYNVTLTVDISNQHPLAREVLLTHPFIIYAERLTLLSIEECIQIRPFAQGNVSEFTVHTLRPTLNTIEAVVEVGPYILTTNDEEFYWRSTILPGRNSCSTSIPPVPPTNVPLITFRNIDINNSTNEISFIMDWTPPEFPNGELESYEVCIRFSDVELSGTEDCGPSFTEISILQLTDPDQPSLMYSPIPIQGPQLTIQIRARNKFNLVGNWSDAAIILTNVTSSPTSSPTDSVPAWVYGIIGVVVAVILIVILVILAVFVFRRYCFHRCGGNKHGVSIDLHGNRRHIHLSSFTPVADEWELRRQEVEVMIKKPLGQGAFGAVYRGMLQPQVMEKLSRRKKTHVRDRRFTINCLVAVKMLKVDNLVASEKANFLKEIEMMKQVSSGENTLRQFVVNMMGCVTISEPMLLVLEFVSHGDLQSYLRAIRKKFSDTYLNHNDESGAYLEPNGTYSQLKPADEEYDKLGVLTERNLVDFARQIAAGMEYLSCLGIIHRDLACRNVLVGDDKILKVSDFGMSRLLPPDEVYVPTSHGPLPLRWMAIEALFYRKFSTKTDVWSYGVVLWEICTMGGFPYPTLGNRDLQGMLRSGYRMEKPETCSQEVYEVMLDCWNLEAEERPNFPELHATFDKFLTQQTQDNYPYMEVLSKPHHLDMTATEIVHDPDPTPINLDIQITDVDADTPMETPQRHLTRSISHNQPKKNLGITASGSNFSLRSLNRGTHDSIQDIQAELARQANWIHTDGGDEDAMVDTRYVDSPTSFVNSRSGSRNQ